jgi:putative hydrolase of the HAD superfamily
LRDVKAIGFDLFNTLITADRLAVGEAVERLIKRLWKSGLTFEEVPFKEAYRHCAMEYLEKARADGRETHNRFWISAALEELGKPVPPDDARIADALDAYFSAFFDYCRLIPGTVEMLGQIRGTYRLALLSNFTHAPACRGLIKQLGLAPFFQTLLISGELGYRKPHGSVFAKLVKAFDVKDSHILYVGDNIEADVNGALMAGIRPVWFTWALDHKVPMLPGVPVGNEEMPDAEIPRVGTWEDFLALLYDGDA